VHGPHGGVQAGSVHEIWDSHAIGDAHSDPPAPCMQVYESAPGIDAKFNLIPYETGRYSACLTMVQDKHLSRYVLQREVQWDLHMSNVDNHHDKVNVSVKERSGGGRGEDGLAAVAHPFPIQAELTVHLASCHHTRRRLPWQTFGTP
jgi:hypothetical protein